MKNILIAVLLVIANISCFGQLESYMIFSPGQRPAVNINAFVSKSISKHWSVNCFSLLMTFPASPTSQVSTWGEVMPGIDYSTGKWNIGLEVGLETIGKPRAGSWIGFFSKKDQIALFVEKGKGDDNHWYNFEYTHTFGKVFDLGLIARRWTLAGPKIGFIIHGKKENATFKPNIFVSAGYDPEDFNIKRAIAGISIPLQ